MYYWYFTLVDIYGVLDLCLRCQNFWSLQIAVQHRCLGSFHLSKEIVWRSLPTSEYQEDICYGKLRYSLSIEIKWTYSPSDNLVVLSSYKLHRFSWAILRTSLLLHRQLKKYCGTKKQSNYVKIPWFRPIIPRSIVHQEKDWQY